MQIGSLNKRVTLQYSTKVSNEMGGFVTSWVDAATIWAAIWPVSAAETVQSMQPTMTISHRVRIRYRSVLRANWRIKFGLRYFNIMSVINPNEKNEMLDLMCKESV